VIAGHPLSVCTLQHVVARPAPVLSKQLAYDIVKSGAPSDGDWDFVYAGQSVADLVTLCVWHGGKWVIPSGALLSYKEAEPSSFWRRQAFGMSQSCCICRRHSL
jgi:hypothetical protein